MQKIFLILGAFFLFLAIGFQFPCFASSPNQSQSEVPLEPTIKLVTAIEVKGNKSISSNTIISKMKTRVANPYQENIISDDLKRLYLLGFFSDIKIDTEEYKEGIKVIITVVERPLIEKITFAGIVRITMKDEKIKELLKSKENQYLDYPHLAEDVKTIKKLYEKIGYIQTVVNYQVDIDKDTNKAKVQFNVIEDKKVTIKNIFVKGNQAFSRGRILRLIKTKRGWLFNRGILKEEVLKEDLERIKSFYYRHGYADVTSNYEIKADAKKPFLIYITIFIKEGKKYLVGNVKIDGNKEIPLKEILAKLKECTPGKVYGEENLKKDIANIQSLYFDRGYISCQVQEATYLNPQTERIDINYRITENNIAYVDKIKIKGNVKTRDVVIRRELRIYPQDKFDGEKLRRSKERLQNLGFFEEISYDTEDAQDPDKKNLIVEVKESKTGAFSFGGGYSTVEEFIGFAEIEQKNFDWKNFPYFTGAGQNLKFRGSFGTLSSGFDLSFTNPWVFDYPVLFGFDAYKRTRERESDVGYGYDEKISGGDLRIGKEISEYFRTDLTYRFDNIEIGSVTETASIDLKREVGTNKISSLIPAITFDSRDNIFDTTKGDLLTCSLEWAGGPFGADKDFWKYYGRVSHYFPLFRRSTLEARLRIGLADNYADSEWIPIYERFFVGGAATVRGYHERKLGPIDPVSKDPLGGNSFLIGNLEYTYPVFNFLKVAAFYDSGNAWAKISDLGSGGVKSSLGLGVRLKSPIGPIMLDYGVPFNKEPGEDDRGSGRFHFSASHGF